MALLILNLTFTVDVMRSVLLEFLRVLLFSCYQLIILLLISSFNQQHFGQILSSSKGWFVHSYEWNLFSFKVLSSVFWKKLENPAYFMPY